MTKHYRRLTGVVAPDRLREFVDGVEDKAPLRAWALTGAHTPWHMTQLSVEQSVVKPYFGAAQR